MPSMAVGRSVRASSFRRAETQRQVKTQTTFSSLMRWQVSAWFRQPVEVEVESCTLTHHCDVYFLRSDRAACPRTGAGVGTASSQA